MLEEKIQKEKILMVKGKWPCIVPVSEGYCPWLGIYGTEQFHVIQRTKGSKDIALKSIDVSRFQCGR